MDCHKLAEDIYLVTSEAGLREMCKARFNNEKEYASGASELYHDYPYVAECSVYKEHSATIGVVKSISIESYIDMRMAELKVLSSICPEQALPAVANYEDPDYVPKTEVILMKVIDQMTPQQQQDVGQALSARIRDMAYKAYKDQNPSKPI